MDTLQKSCGGLLASLLLAPGPLAANHGGDAVAAVMENGRRVYGEVCAACHADNGLGVPGVFPPLQGSGWLEKDSSLLIRIQLHGMQGRLVVGGFEYDAVMPPNGETMEDQDLADVLTYVRGIWGAPGLPPVSAAMVKAERALHHGREVAWTVEELVGVAAPTAAAQPPASGVLRIKAMPAQMVGPRGGPPHAAILLCLLPLLVFALGIGWRGD